MPILTTQQITEATTLGQELKTFLVDLSTYRRFGKLDAFDPITGLARVGQIPADQEMPALINIRVSRLQEILDILALAEDEEEEPEEIDLTPILDAIANLDTKMEDGHASILSAISGIDSSTGDSCENIALALQNLADAIKESNGKDEVIEQNLGGLTGLINSLTDMVQGNLDTLLDAMKEINPFIPRWEEILEAIDRESTLIKASVLDAKIKIDGVQLTVDEIERLAKFSYRNYQILGGGNWFSSESDVASFSLKPETKIRQRVGSRYGESVENIQESNYTCNNILELLELNQAAIYYRAGYHRLPGEVPKSILGDDDVGEDEEAPTTKIPDILSFQEWQFHQFDSILGQFPLDITYKDAEGEEVNLELTNISEVISEILGAVLIASINSDTATNIGMRTLTEITRTFNTSYQAYNYAKANADFLGYRGKKAKKKMSYSFDPKAKNISDSLQESEGNLAVWEINQDNDLMDTLNRILLAAEIAKAALYKPLNSVEDLPGSSLKVDIDEQKSEQDRKWAEFLAKTRNPTGRFTPSVDLGRKIKDITEKEAS